ncbi:MAG: hypothetical protein HRU19_08970 [Pseudobacteriovorax sp.]|nr:hypothetical protein [Pseudobacteriovorax sp.]
MSGKNIVGVQFRRAGKIYDFDGQELSLKLGDRVVVETERGLSLAEVKRLAFSSPHMKQRPTLKPVVRLATKKDIDSEGRLTPEHAESFAKEKIRVLELDMRVIGVEIQFGGNKVIIFFSAPGRVDFRELVKELASGLKTRVELKQVGARDEAKLSGGLGICGREFCCSSFLREFVPVSIKMAKNQNLALNPSKVSGGCGRLLCCLTYEDDTYSQLRKELIPKGSRVRTEDDYFGDVIRGDVLNQTMLIELDSGDQRWIPISELTIQTPGSGVEDDWGDDLDLGELMADQKTAKPQSRKEEGSGRSRPSDKKDRDSSRDGRHNKSRNRRPKQDGQAGEQGEKGRKRQSSNRGDRTDGQNQNRGPKKRQDNRKPGPKDENQPKKKRSRPPRKRKPKPENKD